MKTKLTNMLRGKERKKRKQELILKVKTEVDEEDLYTLKIGVFLFCFVFLFWEFFFFNLIFQPLSYISAIHIFISLKKCNFSYLFLALLGLCYCVGFSLVAERGGSSLSEMHGLLIAGAFLVEHGLQGTRASVVAASGSLGESPGLQSTGSVAMAHGLSCSEAGGFSWIGK